MNYIKHLSAVFHIIYDDKRLNSTHVSLYMALFQFWNITRFADVFFISRQEVMKLSKIGSRTTLYRCLQDLNKWKYIKYFPSKSIYKSSQISMPIFGTSFEHAVNINESSSGHDVVYNTNSNKQIENINKTKLPKKINDVILFFKKHKWPTNEAQKFYNHYQGIGWKIGGKIKIQDWQATARNWMLKANEFETAYPVSRKKDNLRTNKNKDYGQPL